MEAFVILTSKIKLSNAIKDYFSSMSPINFNNIRIYTYGLDHNNGEKILKELIDKSMSNTKITNCFIFTDFGDAQFVAKDFEKQCIKAILCRGSLIETGFVTYNLINGGAPRESIMLSINKVYKK